MVPRMLISLKTVLVFILQTSHVISGPVIYESYCPSRWTLEPEMDSSDCPTQCKSDEECLSIRQRSVTSRNPSMCCPTACGGKMCVEGVNVPPVHHSHLINSIGEDDDSSQISPILPEYSSSWNYLPPGSGNRPQQQVAQNKPVPVICGHFVCGRGEVCIDVNVAECSVHMDTWMLCPQEKQCFIPTLPTCDGFSCGPEERCVMKGCHKLDCNPYPVCIPLMAGNKPTIPSPTACGGTFCQNDEICLTISTVPKCTFNEGMLDCGFEEQCHPNDIMTCSNVSCAPAHLTCIMKQESCGNSYCPPVMECADLRDPTTATVPVSSTLIPAQSTEPATTTEFEAEFTARPSALNTEATQQSIEDVRTTSTKVEQQDLTTVQFITTISNELETTSSIAKETAITPLPTIVLSTSADTDVPSSNETPSGRPTTSTASPPITENSTTSGSTVGLSSPPSSSTQPASSPSDFINNSNDTPSSGIPTASTASQLISDSSSTSSSLTVVMGSLSSSSDFTRSTADLTSSSAVTTTTLRPCEPECPIFVNDPFIALKPSTQQTSSAKPTTENPSGPEYPIFVNDTFITLKPADEQKPDKPLASIPVETNVSSSTITSQPSEYPPDLPVIDPIFTPGPFDEQNPDNPVIGFPLDQGVGGASSSVGTSSSTSGQPTTISSTATAATSTSSQLAISTTTASTSTLAINSSLTQAETLSSLELPAGTTLPLSMTSGSSTEQSTPTSSSIASSSSQVQTASTSGATTPQSGQNGTSVSSADISTAEQQSITPMTAAITSSLPTTTSAFMASSGSDASAPTGISSTGDNQTTLEDLLTTEGLTTGKSVEEMTSGTDGRDKTTDLVEGTSPFTTSSQFVPSSTASPTSMQVQFSTNISPSPTSITESKPQQSSTSPRPSTNAPQKPGGSAILCGHYVCAKGERCVDVVLNCSACKYSPSQGLSCGPTDKRCLAPGDASCDDPQVCSATDNTASEANAAKVCVMCTGGGKTDALRRPQPFCFNQEPAICDHEVCKFTEVCAQVIPGDCNILASKNGTSTSDEEVDKCKPKSVCVPRSFTRKATCEEEPCYPGYRCVMVDPVCDKGNKCPPPKPRCINLNAPAGVLCGGNCVCQAGEECREIATCREVVVPNDLRSWIMSSRSTEQQALGQYQKTFDCYFKTGCLPAGAPTCALSSCKHNCVLLADEDCRIGNGKSGCQKVTPTCLKLDRRSSRPHAKVPQAENRILPYYY